MELIAAIEALRLATSRHCPVLEDAYSKVVIYSDSLIVVDGISWAESLWPRNNWLTRENEPVLNPDLWQELVRLRRRAGRVEFRHVKGHKTNPYNKLADRLAKEAADLVLPQRSGRPPKMVARKLSSRLTEPGVVPMRGQTETIRIVLVRASAASPTMPTSTRWSGRRAPTSSLWRTPSRSTDLVAMRGPHLRGPLRRG